MANKIGRFEILSEITHSEIGAVYKAADPESGQTIALKTIQLQMLEEQADVLVEHILREAAGTTPLSSHNIAQLLGVEVIDSLCCASEEYVQGNSIATMLARNEGFSIWDLQDIVRQTCQGLDHAHSHNVVHYSLEPAKIMVTWDGTVKVLSFGVSCMGAFTCQASGKAPDVLHYVSPEQLRGDPVDARSNIFSLGAILYEMATENKAFPGDDADQVRQAIVEVMPAAPITVNKKIHPVLSEVIMKALCKAPEERYQSGQDLVNDLERCKESSTKAEAKKSAKPAQGSNASQAPKPASRSQRAAAKSGSLARSSAGPGGKCRNHCPVGDRGTRSRFISFESADQFSRTGRRRGRRMGGRERRFHSCAGEGAESRLRIRETVRADESSGASQCGGRCGRTRHGKTRIPG